MAEEGSGAEGWGGGAGGCEGSLQAEVPGPGQAQRCSLRVGAAGEPQLEPRKAPTQLRSVFPHGFIVADDSREVPATDIDKRTDRR